MNLGKKLIITLIELVIIIVLGISFFTYTKKLMLPTKVYYFTREIVSNTILTKNDIATKEIPRNAVNENYVLNADDIIGKSLTTDVFANEIILKDHLIESDYIDPFKEIDLSEYRLYPLSIKYSEALKGNLTKGQKVDLIYCTNTTAKTDNSDSDSYTSSKEESFTYSKTFMQDILIYELSDKTGNKVITNTESIKNNDQSDNKVSEENTTEVSTDNSNNSESSEDGVLWLAVTLDQYEEIVVRQSIGNIYLVNRFPQSTSVNSKGYVSGKYAPVEIGPAEVEIEPN